MLTSLLPFVSFAFLSSVTPGPANVAILAKTVTLGPRKSLRFVAGILVGFGFVLLGCALLFLLGTSISAGWAVSLKLAGAVYLVVVAAEIWRADVHSESRASTAGFLRGMLIHPLSVKAWVFVLLSFSTFTAGASQARIITCALGFLVAATIAHTLWLTAGGILYVHLPDGKLRIVNRVAAAAMVALVASVFVA